MIDIIIACHGDTATGLLSAAEMICGKQENVITLSLKPGMAAESFGSLLKETVDSLNSKNEIIIFTDLMGGTPSNQALKYFLNNDRIQIVTGVNLPMLIEAIFSSSTTNVEEVVELCTYNGINGIKNLKENLKKYKIG
jgi:PTS system mannose-specific IIA component